MRIAFLGRSGSTGCNVAITTPLQGQVCDPAARVVAARVVGVPTHARPGHGARCVQLTEA